MKNYKEVFKQLANSKQNTALHHAQYCLIKATKAKSNRKIEIAEALLRRAFSPKAGSWDNLNSILRRLGYVWQEALLGKPSTTILTDEEFAVYKHILKELTSKNLTKAEPEWTFIFVRQDISPEYQAVQACHAAFKAGNQFTCKPDETWFCLVGVPNEEALLEVSHLLSNNNVEFSSFLEPDINDQLTAIATQPIKAHRKRFLSHYKRLVFER